MVTPSLRERSISVRQNPSRATGSTPEVGSSKNQHGRSVQHGHGKLQPLLDAKRQTVRLRVGHILQTVTFEQLLDASFDLIRGR